MKVSEGDETTRDKTIPIQLVLQKEQYVTWLVAPLWLLLQSWRKRPAAPARQLATAAPLPPATQPQPLQVLAGPENHRRAGASLPPLAAQATEPLPLATASQLC